MIEIKKANFDDIQKISELAEIIWKDHYTPIIGSDQVSYMIEKFQSYTALKNSIVNDNYVYYIACYDENMCGYCGIRVQDDEIFLSKLYVHKDYRGKKIARNFLERVISDNPNQNKIRLTVNKHNTNTINAYKKMGFIITDEVCSDIGNGYVMDDYIMVCEMR